MSLDLSNAIVTGFFSLPSPSIAEYNPEGYRIAMASAPKGACSCMHCGMGILHHVVIEIERKEYFIGTTCALKVGSPKLQRCVREKLTTAQAEKIDADRKLKSEAWKKEIAQREAAKKVRLEAIGDIVKVLEDAGTEFHRSLADQLRCGPLSNRQAECVAKLFYGRYSKKKAEQWDSLVDRCQRFYETRNEGGNKGSFDRSS